MGQRPFRDLLETCDRLLVDSGSFREDGASRLSALSAVVADGQVVVCDIGWMRLSLWRELLAGIFDHPLLTRELRAVRSVRIDVARPGDTFRISKAASFAGWLASTLGWDVARPMEPEAGTDRLVGAFRSGRALIPVEFRGVGVLDRTTRSAGSLVRVELELGRRDASVRARVTRQSDHLLATADWNGAQVSRRAGRLEPFGEAPYVADALDRTGQDRIFEAALAMATKLIGG
jgi:glucose-6-phosphate dehydrogenase assembly protein OpcA